MQIYSTPLHDERTFARQVSSSFVVVVPRHRVCFNRRNVDVVSLALWRTIKGGDSLASLCLTALQLSRVSPALPLLVLFTVCRATSRAEGPFVSPLLWLLGETRRGIFISLVFSFFFFSRARERTVCLFSLTRSYLLFDFVTSVGNLVLFPPPTLQRAGYAYTIESCNILKLISMEFSKLFLKNLYERITFGLIERKSM